MHKVVRSLFLIMVTLVVINLFFPVSITRTMAATSALNSTALSLQVNTAPYSYQVIERSTSAVLVSQNTSSFTVNGTTYTTTNASAIMTTATTLDANLALAGTTSTAHIKFTFTTPQVLQVLLTFNGGTPTQIAEQFNDQQEHYYGIWEYPFNGNLDNRGNDADYLGIGPSNGVNFSSGRAPFYMTSRNYGIYVETQSQGHYTVAVNGKTSFSFKQAQLKYDVIYGPGYYDILGRYTTIAGGAYMPPTWAFDSSWWKDDDHQDLHNATNAQGNVIDVANQLQNYHIPASSTWIDRPYSTGFNGWGNSGFDSSFPNPAQMVSDLHARGLNLMLWIANRAWNNLYTEGNANGYLFPGNSNLGPAADMRNASAYNWFQQKLNAYVNLGVKGYKIDRGEEGEQPDAVQNQNVALFTKMAYQGQQASHSNDAFVFARNAVDTSRQYSALWNGDSNSSFNGLKYSIASGLRSSAINFPMWGSDTGGYLRSSSTPSEELFARWLEFSAYSPIMEVLVGAGHTPWYNYDNTLINITRDQASTHHDLIPYTRSFVYAATGNGAPVMRPLALSYASDPNPNIANMTDEYKLGSEILVAPVITQNATNRSVYLPAADNWVNYNDKTTVYQGGQTIVANAPLDTMPLFAREGAIIPRGDILQGNNNWTAGWSPNLRIEMFPSDTRSNTFSYYTGSGVQNITSSKVNGNMTIQFGDLGLGGKLNIYVKNFSSIVRNGVTLTNGSDYTYNSSTHLLTISFSGATTLLLNGASSIFSGNAGAVNISNLSVADTTNAAAWSVQTNLQTGIQQYGDRTIRLTTVPTTLTGAAWLRTANNSKLFTGNPLATFTINRQADIYVAVDARLGKRPWQDASWSNSGLTIADDEGGGVQRTFTLYKKTFPAGQVSLGPNAGATQSSMYTVIVT